MPSTKRSATVTASPERVWEMIANPRHLQRWWPEVSRVTDILGNQFTMVIMTRKGKPMRVDYHTVVADEPSEYAWLQDVIGTPFERVVAEHLTTVKLEPAPNGTHVTLTERHKLKGYARLGGWMLRRVNKQRLDEALAKLETVVA